MKKQNLSLVHVLTILMCFLALPVICSPNRWGTHEIFMMNADGANLATLTKNTVSDVQPSLGKHADGDGIGDACESAVPPDCASTSITFASVTVVPIPTGPGVVSSTITVSGIPAGAYLYDVNVVTNIDHTNNADIDMTVASPGSARIVTLTTDNGGTNDNVFANTTWDDDADPDGQVPFAPSGNPGSVSDNLFANLTNNLVLAPEEPLAAFVGTPVINGDWTITISDDAAANGGSLNGWSLVLTTLSAAPTTGTVSGSNPTDFNIPNPGAVASTINIPTGGSILDVNVTASISHEFASDLQITLTHQTTGTVVTLISNQPEFNVPGAHYFTNTTFDDSANATLGQLPYATNSGLATDHPYVNNVNVPQLAPVESLGAFIGEDAAGDWILTVADTFVSDGGALNGWSINITTADCAPPTDTTAPIVTPSVIGTLGSNGWYTSNVGVSWTVTDAESDVSSQNGCDLQNVTADTAGVTFTCSATSGGGTASLSVTVKRDATAPTLNPTVSPNPVALNGSATASSGAADTLSGIAWQSCGTPDTSTTGGKTVNCTATDLSGNTVNATAGYTVNGPSYTFTGFFQPVDNLPILNEVKAGSAIPVKFSLGGNFGLNIFAAGYPASGITTCNSSTPADVIDETVNAGGSSLTYDVATGRYTYVWKTDKSWKGQCRMLIVKLNDGNTYLAQFRFK